MSFQAVADKHQTAIARRTLRMNEAGARIMGGMTHKEAREFLARKRKKEQTHVKT